MIRQYAVKARDDEIRKNSTSGGVFSLLAKEILDQGGVVYGASFDDNAVLRHIGIEKAEDLPMIRGTKYVQSNAGICFPELKSNLEKQRRVLFCGTPCQNAALRKYLDSSVSQGHLIQADFICMGLPALSVFNEYKQWLEENKGKKLRKMLCRDKISGWKQSSVRLTYEDGSEETTSIHNNEYLKPFLREFGLSQACYHCSHRGKDRPTDITMADYWGVQDIDPEIDDNLGVSLVFIHSEQGLDLFHRIKESTICKEIEDDGYLKYNPYMIRSPEKRIPNQYFYSHLGKMDYGKLVERCILFCRIRNKKDRVIRKVTGRK